MIDMKVTSSRSKLKTRILLEQLSQTHILYIAAEISDTKEQVLEPEAWLSNRKNMDTAWRQQKDQLWPTPGSTGRDVRYYEYMSHMSQTYGDVHESIIEKIIVSDEMKIYNKKVSAILATLKKKIADPNIQAELKSPDSSTSTKRLKLSFDMNFKDLENTSGDILNNILDNVRLEVVDIEVKVNKNKNKKKKKQKKVEQSLPPGTDKSISNVNEQSNVLFLLESDTTNQSDSEIVIIPPKARVLKTLTPDIIENDHIQIDTNDSKINNYDETKQSIMTENYSPDWYDYQSQPLDDPLDDPFDDPFDDPLKEHRRYNYHNLEENKNPYIDPCTFSENYYMDPHNRVYFVDPHTEEQYAVVDPHTGEQLHIVDPHTGEQYSFVDPHTGEQYTVVDPHTGEQYACVDPYTGEQYQYSYSFFY